jgi:hypothetical protein
MQREDASARFAGLLAGDEAGVLIDPDSFIRRYWSHQIFIGPIAPGLRRAIDVSSEIEDLIGEEYVYQLTDSVPCSLRFRGRASRRAKSVADAVGGLSSGWSLEIRNLRDLLSRRHPLTPVIDTVIALTGCPLVNSLLFVTPPRCQALAPHSDSDHTLTFQLKGSKRWHIIKEGSPPLAVDQEFVLREGELLYVPPNFVHDVASADEFSVSVAFVFEPIQYDLLWNFILDDPRLISIMAAKASPRVAADSIDELAEAFAPFVEAVQARAETLSAAEFASFVVAQAEARRGVRHRRSPLNPQKDKPEQGRLSKTSLITSADSGDRA